MNLKEQMASLRSFVESLSYADSVSTKQISILSQKLETFFESIEELDYEAPEDQPLENPSDSIHLDSSEGLNSFDDFDDDLPF